MVVTKPLYHARFALFGVVSKISFFIRMVGISSGYNEDVNFEEVSRIVLADEELELFTSLKFSLGG
jgi:hypothetical protein